MSQFRDTCPQGIGTAAATCSRQQHNCSLPALWAQAPQGSTVVMEDAALELTALPELLGTAADCLGQAGDFGAGGKLRGRRWGAERPAPTSRPHTRRPPLSFLTSRSAFAARRNWGLCFLIIFRNVLRGAVRFILLFLFLPLRPPRTGLNGSRPPSAVRIRRPSVAARPPWRTSQRPRAAPPPRSAQGPPALRAPPRPPAPPLPAPPAPAAARRRFPGNRKKSQALRERRPAPLAPSGRAAAGKAERARGTVPPPRAPPAAVPAPPLSRAPRARWARPPSLAAAFRGRLSRRNDSGCRLKSHSPTAGVADVGWEELPELMLNL